MGWFHHGVKRAMRFSGLKTASSFGPYCQAFSSAVSSDASAAVSALKIFCGRALVSDVRAGEEADGSRLMPVGIAVQIRPSMTPENMSSVSTVGNYFDFDGSSESTGSHTGKWLNSIMYDTGKPCTQFGSAVAVSGTGQSETPQSLEAPAFAGLSPIAESDTKVVLTT